MKKLLTLKHWQLFCLLIVLPFILQLIHWSIAIVTMDMKWFFLLFPLVTLLCMAVYLGWIYTLGTQLVKKLPPGVRMNVGVFKILLAIPAVYITSIAVMIGFLPEMPALASDEDAMKAIQLILPLHLFSMFCMFYSIYFNAKALRSAELKRKVSFSDFTGEFFLFWFFPVGIWLLQPRINKLFEAAPERETGPILYRED
ncbi:MAG: hypothetical protein BGO09_08835 [Bacteroidetes bacterium 47-18]|nr:MAG: hypothetical protein BGO09_08835 [Bacteroidetes bacterium 47-18]